VTELVLALLLGVGLGVITGLPLGVVNVAIVEAAARRGARTAAGIGVGGAIADATHAGLAFGGVGRVVVGRPAVATAMYVIAGAILLGYAVVLWRARTAAAAGGAADREGPATFGRGVGTGIGLTLPNPAALGAWLAVAAAIAPPSVTRALVTAAGVGLGSAAWFVTLGRLAARSSAAALTPRRWLTRSVAIAIALLGAAAIARGLL